MYPSPPVPYTLAISPNLGLLMLQPMQTLKWLDTGASGKNNNNKNKIKESPKKGKVLVYILRT